MINYLRDRMNKNIKQFGEPTALDELSMWCINIINAELSKSKNELWGFSWDINYSTIVSNSHSRPIDGVSNWAGKEVLPDGSSAPKGYPGFVGRVWVRALYDTEPSMADVVQKTLTYPGTGGSGSYHGWEGISRLYFKEAGHSKSYMGFRQPNCWSWDYRFYLMDFPLIEQDIENQFVLHLLKNNDSSFKINHKFLWEHPDALEHDQKFRQHLRNKLTI